MRQRYNTESCVSVYIRVHPGDVKWEDRGNKAIWEQLGAGGMKPCQNALPTASFRGVLCCFCRSKQKKKATWKSPQVFTCERASVNQQINLHTITHENSVNLWRKVGRGAPSLWQRSSGSWHKLCKGLTQSVSVWMRSEGSLPLRTPRCRCTSSSRDTC